MISLDMKASNLTFIDLFAGIGGMRLAMEDESTKCVFSSEWDQYAQKTYEANFGDKPAGDITKISEETIPEHDILLAGFPCQPFSNIGQRKGFEHATQGTLFFDIVRILNKKKPKSFLLENVPGIKTIQNGETFKIILNTLNESGYDVFHSILDASEFNLPQVRKRLYIVGFLKELKVNFAFPMPFENKVSIAPYLEDNPHGYDISLKTQQNYLFKVDDGRPQIVDSFSTIQVKTLVASYHKIQRLTGTFVKGGTYGLRLLSEKECKRLQGFPDDFIIPVSRTQMYRQLGNSVAIPVVRAISLAIKEQLCQQTLKSSKSSLKLTPSIVKSKQVS